MVTGRLPFTAETPMGVVVKHIYDAAAVAARAEARSTRKRWKPSSSRVSPNRSSERYHSAGELARALAAGRSAAPSLAQSRRYVGLDSNATPQFSPAPDAAHAASPLSNKSCLKRPCPPCRTSSGARPNWRRIGARLERDRFVIITGMAGMGKTTLGAKLARSVADDPDRIFWFTFDHVEKSTADALYWALAIVSRQSR